MANRFCPNCGAALVPNATFCSSCGASVTPGAALPTGAPPPVTAWQPSAARPATSPYPAGFGNASPPSAARTTARDRAFGSVQWAAILQLVAALSSIVILFDDPASSLVTETQTGSTTSVYLSATAVDFLIIVVVVSVVLELVTLFLYWGAFRSLSDYQNEFNTPAKLVIVEIIGVLLVFFGVLGLFSAVLQAISCANGAPITSACFSLGTLGGLILLIGLGAVLAFIGFIGLLIGIWRLGTITSDSFFHIGAVLLIIPLLNIVGAVLIAVAAGRNRNRGATQAPGSFG